MRVRGTKTETENEDVENLLEEFKSFLKSAEGHPKITKVMDEVVDDLLNKDILYDPIKALS